MKHLKNIVQIIILVSSMQFLSATRSFLRLQDPTPEIHIRYLDPKSETYIISNPHLQASPLFKFFDKDYFYEHLLSHSPVTYRADKTK